MIPELIKLIQQVTPSTYKVIFEEAKMMNVRADELTRDSGLVYIEEYKSGTYNAAPTYGELTKQTRIDIYFCKFVPMHGDAIERERIREGIEAEAVRPFVQAMQASQWLSLSAIQFAHPIPRFDANEVSIRLTITLSEEFC